MNETMLSQIDVPGVAHDQVDERRAITGVAVLMGEIGIEVQRIAGLQSVARFAYADVGRALNQDQVLPRPRRVRLGRFHGAALQPEFVKLNAVHAHERKQSTRLDSTVGFAQYFGLTTTQDVRPRSLMRL